MSKMYQFKYDNGLMDGVVYIGKEGSTWTSTIMNINGCFSNHGFKTKKAAVARVEHIVGASLKPMPMK